MAVSEKRQDHAEIRRQTANQSGISGTEHRGLRLPRADELRLNEYDEDGSFVQTIYANDFDSTSLLNFWSSNDSGGQYYASSEGHLAKGSLMLSGTTDDANTSTRYFRPTAGHSYEAWVIFR